MVFSNIGYKKTDAFPLFVDLDKIFRIRIPNMKHPNPLSKYLNLIYPVTILGMTSRNPNLVRKI